MNHLDRAQSFIELCRSGTPAGELAIVFGHELEACGFRFFSCCSHVDPLRPPRGAVILHNYPAEWVRAFSELDFYYIDPVFHYANRSLTPFFWDADEFRAELTAPQLEIMEEARRFGIEHGYTVPLHAPRSPGAYRASCSVVPDSAAVAAVAAVAYLAVQLMACYMYSALSLEAEAKAGGCGGRGLTRRERQCLELAAQGKSDWVAGRILGISERTVHNHIEHAKRRLGVATRVQAIVHALVSRQIAFGDVIRSTAEEDADSRRAGRS
ncbi:MAG TPA: LuxR family transcriptional regulator [Steroidobacteraceae bacterium]|nr:LuxR family transcriptional regulator [Steroidobacteraceae bacterium]